MRDEYAGNFKLLCVVLRKRSHHCPCGLQCHNAHSATLPTTPYFVLYLLRKVVSYLLL